VVDRGVPRSIAAGRARRRRRGRGCLLDVPLVVPYVGWAIGSVGMGIVFPTIPLSVMGEVEEGREAGELSSMILVDYLGVGIGAGLGGASVALADAGTISIEAGPRGCVRDRDRRRGAAGAGGSAAPRRARRLSALGNQMAISGFAGTGGDEALCQLARRAGMVLPLPPGFWWQWRDGLTVRRCGGTGGSCRTAPDGSASRSRPTMS
jgi:hypothetical protein